MHRSCASWRAKWHHSRPLAFVTASLALFIAFLFLLLVSISLPVVQVYFSRLSVASTNGTTIVRFGLWGYCRGGAPLDTPHFDNVHMGAGCSQPQLGYTFDSVISKSKSSALILHVIECALAFMALASVLCAFRSNTLSPRRHTCYTVATSTSVLAAILTTISFATDTSFASNKIQVQVGGVFVHSWGNAVSMTLVAGIALWIATFACLRLYTAPQH